MLHDAVLPGARVLGEPCPACGVELPFRATGAPVNSLRSVVRLADAYQKAVEGMDTLLKERLNSGCTEHRFTWQNGQQYPCPYRSLPSWLLAQCQRPENVTEWLNAISPYWTPPKP
ncbi:hypothetical protein TUSST3_45520 [Streptomyces sp. TUS-ST3]|jgi:hypothetical protein|nr:hypothetical protein TUSST3_45520 [Streptomyces sp. TUS-ST3]